MNAFLVVAASVACVLVRLIVWSCSPAAILAVATFAFVPVFSLWIILFNAIAFCRQKGGN
jgi:hypothetical protein